MWVNEMIFLELGAGIEILVVAIEQTSQKAVWSQGWRDCFFHVHGEAGQADKQRERGKTRDRLLHIPGSGPL